MNLTPKEIVSYLNEYIIGQKDAKKAIAIALRNRYRRMKLPKEMQDEIMPKNILMIYIEKKILEKLLPPLPKGATSEKRDDYEKSYERMLKKFRDGELDDLKIEIEINKSFGEGNDSSLPPEIIKVQESFVKILGSNREKIKKEVSIKDAKVQAVPDKIQAKKVFKEIYFL